MGWLVAVLVALTTFRATRLVVKDTIPVLKVPRDAVVNWLDPDDAWKIEWLASRELAGKPYLDPPAGHFGAVGKSLAYLLTCPWCMSVWVGAGVVLLTNHWVSVPVPWLTWAAACAITGLLANSLDSDD